MIASAIVFYSDGSKKQIIYRLSSVGRFLKSKRAINKFREIQSIPISPWLVEMSFTDGIAAAVGKEIIRIKITSNRA